MGPEVWSGYNAQRPACRNPLPSVRPYFLKVTQSHKTKPLPGDQDADTAAHAEHGTLKPKQRRLA